jgi:hypothetical protein
MKKLLVAGAALAMLGGAAYADDAKKESFGAAAGGTTGAVAGAVVGGPVGAIVGGVAGAALGAATAVPEEARVYVAENPVDSVTIEGQLAEGYAFDDSVTIHPIPDQPKFGYVYVDNRPVIVSMDTRKVVYAAEAETTASVSVDIPDTTITYVEKHPVDPVVLEGKVVSGEAIPDSVELIEIPDNPKYAYVYVDSGPVIVERDTRKVVWMR